MIARLRSIARELVALPETARAIRRLCGASGLGDAMLAGLRTELDRAGFVAQSAAFNAARAETFGDRLRAALLDVAGERVQESGLLGCGCAAPRLATNVNETRSLAFERGATLRLCLSCGGWCGDLYALAGVSTINADTLALIVERASERGAL